MFDPDEVKAVVRLNGDGTMTRVERVPSPASKDIMTLLLMTLLLMIWAGRFVLDG
mgnify:CR=1 FL=1